MGAAASHGTPPKGRSREGTGRRMAGAMERGKVVVRNASQTGTSLHVDQVRRGDGQPSTGARLIGPAASNRSNAPCVRCATLTQDRPGRMIGDRHRFTPSCSPAAARESHSRRPPRPRTPTTATPPAATLRPSLADRCAHEGTIQPFNGPATKPGPRSGDTAGHQGTLGPGIHARINPPASGRPAAIQRREAPPGNRPVGSVPCRQGGPRGHRPGPVGPPAAGPQRGDVLNQGDTSLSGSVPRLRIGASGPPTAALVSGKSCASRA